MSICISLISIKGVKRPDYMINNGFEVDQCFRNMQGVAYAYEEHAA